MHYGIYCHSQGNYFFEEIRSLFAQGLRALGYQVTFGDEQSGYLAVCDYHIVVAAHEFLFFSKGKQLKRLPKNLIIVATEQHTSLWYKRVLPFFKKAEHVWEMDLQNVDLLQKMGINAQYCPLAYLPDFEWYEEIKKLPMNRATCFLNPSITTESYWQRAHQQRPIDLFFIGSITERRTEFFTMNAEFFAPFRNYFRLIDTGYPLQLVNPFELDSRTVCGLEQRTKIVLNIHRADEPYFEWHRMLLHGMAQGALVISEPIQDIPSAYQVNRDFVTSTLENMASTITYYLTTAKGQRAAATIAQQGQNTFRNDRKFTEILKGLTH
ncbi:MAG: hypothetical protein AB8G22_06850 [Saprospiraceae bacterium]